MEVILWFTICSLHRLRQLENATHDRDPCSHSPEMSKIRKLLVLLVYLKGRQADRSFSDAHGR